MLTDGAEDVPKGANDRPLKDVIISDSGEVRLEFSKLLLFTDKLAQLLVEPVVDNQGNEVPLRAEL